MVSLKVKIDGDLFLIKKTRCYGKRARGQRSINGSSKTAREAVSIGFGVRRPNGMCIKGIGRGADLPSAVRSQKSPWDMSSMGDDGLNMIISNDEVERLNTMGQGIVDRRQLKE
ncbi:hypothetical protein Ancab_029665 [Ancistrocladus abbreviatus]